MGGLEDLWAVSLGLAGNGSIHKRLEPDLGVSFLDIIVLTGLFIGGDVDGLRCWRHGLLWCRRLLRLDGLW